LAGQALVKSGGRKHASARAIDVPVLEALSSRPRLQSLAAWDA